MRIALYTRYRVAASETSSEIRETKDAKSTHDIVLAVFVLRIILSVRYCRYLIIIRVLVRSFRPRKKINQTAHNHPCPISRKRRVRLYFIVHYAYPHQPPTRCTPRAPLLRSLVRTAPAERIALVTDAARSAVAYLCLEQTYEQFGALCNSYARVFSFEILMIQVGIYYVLVFSDVNRK